jgi:hypothetical protein
VRVLDGSGKGYAQDTLTKLLQYGFVSGGFGDAHRKAIASEIRYAPGHAAEAKMLLRYVDGALVQDPSVTDGVVLVIGELFSAITIDPTATTLPVTSVNTAPVGPNASTAPDTNGVAGAGKGADASAVPDVTSTTRAPANIATTTTVPPDEEC